MKLQDLAAALGISPAMVTKLKKRGMPTTSVEVAAKWRWRHLEPARTKGMRAGTWNESPTTVVGHVSTSPTDATAMLLQVQELGLLAHDALERGTFAAVAPLLRQAMARVPFAQRERIELTPEVWDALTAAIPHDLQPSAEDAAGDLPDSFMQVFWQQIALGEYADMAIHDDGHGNWSWVKKK